MAQSEETSKFSGALARLKKGPPTAAAVEEPPPAPRIERQPDPEPPPARVSRPKGRPAGKRSDPDFKATTLILRERTTKAARRKLEDTGSSLDLSELVERLLTDWTRNGG